LVFFDGSRNPVELLAIVADRLYPKAELLPCSYEVRFDRKEVEKPGKARVLAGKAEESNAEAIEFPEKRFL
jgi:hypothetical protein